MPRSEALNKARRDLGKAWYRWRIPFMAGFGVVLILVLGNFGYQFFAAKRQAALASAVEEATVNVASTVEKSVSEAIDFLNQLVDPVRLAPILESGDARAVDDAMTALAESRDLVLKAWLVPVEYEETDYDTVPPFSFASLDLLRRSEESDRLPPPEVHLFKNEGQNLAKLWRIKDAEGGLIGHLLVALDLVVIDAALGQAQLETGYAELIQPAPKGKPLQLGKLGNEADRLGPASLRLKVKDTAWNVLYWVEGGTIAAAKGSGSVPVLPVALGVGLLLGAAGGAYAFWRRRRLASLGDSIETREDALAEKLAALKTGDGVDELAVDGGDAPDDDASAAETDDGGGEPSDLPASIFRAYDVRGIVGKTLTPEIVRQIGRAIGSEAYERGQQTLAVAADGRASSAALSEALINGLRETGRDVIDVGMLPTPVLYFATHYLNTASGVMVTGSHNPAQYNGLKIVLAGDTLHGDDITALRTRIASGDLATGDGSYQNMDVLDEYIRRVTEDIPVALGGAFKVVIDAGNGVAGAVAPKLIRALGHDVVELYCDVDGTFPNHHPDPSRPENLADLISAVRENDADIGFAFDGDGDRLGVVDSAGNIIWPDRQIMLFAVDVLGRNAGSEIVFDVKCSSRLAKVIKAKGGQPVMWKTGHSFIKNKLKASGAPLAGEMSGHIFFNERWYGFDDAMYAAARMLEILCNVKAKPAEVFSKLPSGVCTPELRLDMDEGQPFEFMGRLMEGDRFPDGQVTDIDGIRVDYPDRWGLVRASNTTPSLVLRFEGDDEEALRRVQEQFRTVLLELDSGLSLPF